jgi:hypothetical protein
MFDGLKWRIGIGQVEGEAKAEIEASSMTDEWKVWLKGLAVAVGGGLIHAGGELYAHGKVNWVLALSTAGALFWAYVTDTALPKTAPWDGIGRRKSDQVPKP